MRSIEQRLSEAEDALREAGRALESSKIWGGMQWIYHPIPDFKYKKAREAVASYWESVRHLYRVES